MVLLYSKLLKVVLKFTYICLAMQPSTSRASSNQETQHPHPTPNKNGRNVIGAKIQASPPPKNHLIFRLLPTITLAGLIGLWSVAGRIPIRVVGQSILIQPRSIISFQPRGSGGQVQELLVKPGARVSVGQVIAVLDLPDLQEQLANQKQKLAEYELENLAIANAQNLRSELQEQTLELESISIPQQIDANLKEIEANQKAIIAVRKQRAAYEHRIAQLNEFIALAKARFEAGKVLIDQGVIAEFNSDFVNAENLYQQNQNERTTLFASLEALSAKEEELTSSTIALQAQNQNLRSQLENLRTQLANLKLTDLQADTQRQNQIDDLNRDILNL